MLSFAIVVPNFNQSRFLWSVFESLRHQSSPFQLAVMDGGSTDDFRAVAEKYADMITYLRSGPDKGQASAIKEGMERISGDVVSWLNADDYYFPGALDKVASCFEANPEVDVIYGDAIHVTPEGFFLSYFPPIQEYNAHDLTRTCFICQPACFVRRSAYEAVGGVKASLQYTMDWELWCRLSSVGAKFKYLRELLAAVRYYPETKTMSGSTRRYREIYRIERKFGKRLYPLSCFGAYLYGLTFKPEKTMRDRIFCRMVGYLELLRRRFYKEGDPKDESAEVSYGFHRWEPMVEKRCTIHLPWYDGRQWTRLLLKVEPADIEYRIEVNDQVHKGVFTGGGYLAADMPRLSEPRRKIAIEALGADRWKLLEFRFDISDN